VQKYGHEELIPKVFNPDFMLGPEFENNVMLKWIDLFP
jgi:hypothetical protein